MCVCAILVDSLLLLFNSLQQFPFCKHFESSRVLVMYDTALSILAHGYEIEAIFS